MSDEEEEQLKKKSIRTLQFKLKIINLLDFIVSK